FFSKQSPVALAGLPGEVAVALAEPAAVAVYGVDPEGRLERRRYLGLGAAPAALWSGDLDDDGQPELVVTHGTSGELTVLDPVSGAGQVLTVGGDPSAVAVADVDGDLFMDLVVTDRAQSRKLLRGKGGGQFEPAREVPGRGASAVALADLDGDGDVDALTREVDGAGVSVSRNNGSGELSSPTEIPFATAMGEAEFAG